MAKRRSILKRVALTTGLAAAMLFGGYKGVEYSSRNATREYATHNVARFVQEQNDKLGIKHNRVPSIEFGLYDGSNFGDTNYGLFDDKTGNVIINDRACVTSSSPVRNWLYGLFHKTKSIDEVLHHELGHAYVEEQLPLADIESFPDKTLTDYRVRGRVTSQKMISEGIADYFAWRMLNKPTPNGDKIWPTDPQEPVLFPKRAHFYDGGNALVAPILDKFGVENGVVKLIKKTPISLNRSSLKSYQTEMLKE